MLSVSINHGITTKMKLLLLRGGLHGCSRPTSIAMHYLKDMEHNRMKHDHYLLLKHLLNPFSSMKKCKNDELEYFNGCARFCIGHRSQCYMLYVIPITDNDDLVLFVTYNITLLRCTKQIMLISHCLSLNLMIF